MQLCATDLDCKPEVYAGTVKRSTHAKAHFALDDMNHILTSKRATGIPFEASCAVADLDTYRNGFSHCSPWPGNSSEARAMECAVAAAQGCGADRLQPSGAERVAVTFAALLKGALALFHAFHNALSSLLFCSLNKTQTLLFVPLQAPLSGSSQALCETL
jgi:hypothetical protein